MHCQTNLTVSDHLTTFHPDNLDNIFPDENRTKAVTLNDDRATWSKPVPSLTRCVQAMY